MRQEHPSRRIFLRVFGVGAVGVIGAGCGAAGSGDPASFGEVSAGNVGNLLDGVLRKVLAESVCIVRDAGGVYALTTICTH